MGRLRIAQRQRRSKRPGAPTDTIQLGAQLTIGQLDLLADGEQVDVDRAASTASLPGPHTLQKATIGLA